MKKVLSCLLLFILLSCGCIYKVNAKVNLVKDTHVEELEGGIIFRSENITTTDYNSSSTYNSFVQSFTLEGSNKASKIVTWSYTGDSGKLNTSLVTLDKIAQDYEDKHPGWMVVGGINAEGFHSQDGYNEISNMFVQDGKLMRTGVSSEQFKEVIGFKDDNSYIVKRVPDFSSSMMLSLYDEENNLINKINVEGLNKVPSDGNISIISLELEGNISGNGCKVVKGVYDLYRRKTFFIPGTYSLSKNDDGIYLEGNIDGDYNGTISASYNNFYIMCKNDEAYNQIKNAYRVSCQYEFIDEFKDCKSVTGYMFKLVEKNKVINPDSVEDNREDFRKGYTIADDSFKYGNHDYMRSHYKNRSSIGFKEDGSIVLLTAINGTGGPSQYELGSILNSYGCNYAYQFDGGGSVAIIRRKEDGGFEFLNKGADGHQRSISTGVFFICPKYDIEVKEVTKNSISFENIMGLKNIKININSKEYNMDENILVVDGLKSGTTYNISYSFDRAKKGSTELVHEEKQMTIKTVKFTPPSVVMRINDITKTTCKLSFNIDEIYDVVAKIGEKEYKFENGNYLIDGLDGDKLYSINVSYKIKDLDTNEEFEYTISNTQFRTLDFDIPTVIKLEVINCTNKNMTIDYFIKDDDSRIDYVTLYCGDNAYEISDLEGSIKVPYVDGEIYLNIDYFGNNYVPKSYQTDSIVPVVSDGCKSNFVIVMFDLMVFISVLAYIKLRSKRN